MDSEAWRPELSFCEQRNAAVVGMVLVGGKEESSWGWKSYRGGGFSAGASHRAVKG